MGLATTASIFRGLWTNVRMTLSNTMKLREAACSILILLFEIEVRLSYSLSTRLSLNQRGSAGSP